MTTYDVTGRLTNLLHKDGLGNVLQNTTYSYDLADRLTAQTVDGTVTSYSYDTYGNPVPRTPVVWTVRSGGGVLAPALDSTSAAGTARTRWTLGPRLDSAQAALAYAVSRLAVEVFEREHAALGLRNLFRNADRLPAIAAELDKSLDQ